MNITYCNNDWKLYEENGKKSLALKRPNLDNMNDGRIDFLDNGKFKWICYWPEPKDEEGECIYQGIVDDLLIAKLQVEIRAKFYLEKRDPYDKIIELELDLDRANQLAGARGRRIIVLNRQINELLGIE